MRLFYTCLRLASRGLLEFLACEVEKLAIRYKITIKKDPSYVATYTAILHTMHCLALVFT